MKPRYWSLAIVLILINYLIFATLYTFLMETNFGGRQVTRTPIPTFTPAPAEPIIIVPTPEPITPEPSPTATRVVDPAESNAGEGAAVGDSIIEAGLVQSGGQNAAPYLVSPALSTSAPAPAPIIRSSVPSTLTRSCRLWVATPTAPGGRLILPVPPAGSLTKSFGPATLKLCRLSRLPRRLKSISRYPIRNTFVSTSNGSVSS